MLKVKFRFRPGHRDAFSPGPPWKLHSLFINLTERCNLGCIYCHAYQGSGPQTMSLGLVEDILNQAVDMGTATVLPTGGEPFCYPHFEDVLRLVAERGLGCKIATNGTFLDDGHVQMLLRHEVRSLQISLDTLDPGLYSRMKGVGEDTFHTVVDGIQRCVQTGRLHIAVSAVAHRSVQNGLTDMLRFCHDSGANTFTVYRLIPYGRGAVVPGEQFTEEEFLGLLDELFEAFVQLPEHWAVDLGFPWARDSRVAQRWGNRLNMAATGCVGGKSHLAILADGEAVPCVCLEDRSFSCGNVKEKSLAELWNAPLMGHFRGEVQIEGCAGCPEFPSCLGGCRTLAWLTSGRKDAPDPVCRLWQVAAPAGQL